MKIKPRVATLLIALLVWGSPALASEADDLQAMVERFLATSDKREAHVWFWAEDLVYTSSSGARFGKADILSGFDDAPASNAPAATTYSGDEFDVRIYGDTAVVAFKLVGTPTDKSGSEPVLYYFNTGTLLKRDGEWRVVAWQATKIPES